MPSNRELIAEATALGKELGVVVDTFGMNNAKLVALVDGLKAKRDGCGEEARPQPDLDDVCLQVAEVAPETVAVKQPEPESPRPIAPAPPTMVNGADDGYLGGPPKKPEPSVGPRYKYTVARGHAFSCGPRGVVGPGKEIRVSDFGTDPVEAQQRLDGHILAGRILVK